MSNNQLIPLYSESAADSPLDLTVKRTDMDPNEQTDYLQKSFTTTIATLNNPMTEYSPYQQSSSSGYYETEDQYSEVYNTTPPMYSSPQVSPPSQNLSVPQRATFSAPSSPVNDGNQEHYKQNSTNSSILPKKRKNLWRPYDRSALKVAFSDEKDLESGSDSGSNSSSDYEFKAPPTPMDPMKKRKRNMLKYAEDNFENQNGLGSQQSNTSSSQTNTTSAMEYSEISVPSSNDNTETFVPSRSVTEGSDVREQVISGIKGRDVFGWSLKLSKPAEDVTIPIKDDQNVCQDGDKTYFELQTVRKNSPTEGSQQNANGVSPVKPRNSFFNPPNQQNTKQAANGGRRNGANKKQVKESEKESNKKATNNRVYIQRRDNVVESFDETQNIPENNDTEKKLSLIDLVEEIEADALKQNKEEAEKTQKRNEGIVKLLEQCNYVKLQALDYLMSNVLIQERGRTYKSKNETVQKMLKGDKIRSVNMLDVVELQVEMGLN